MCLHVKICIALCYYFVLGSAYMYSTLDNGVTWSERQKLLASDGAAGDQFGWAVSLYFDKLAVSSYLADGNAGKGYREMSFYVPFYFMFDFSNYFIWLFYYL